MGRTSPDVDRCLPVPQLPHVVVAGGRPVDRGVDVEPAEEDVARRLHQALALDDALPVVRPRRRPFGPLEHRRLGLLDLEEQRIVRVSPEQQHDPAARADAADAHDLAREIDVAVSLQQLAAIAQQRLLVLRQGGLQRRLDGGRRSPVCHEIGDRLDERRIGDDARLPVDQPA